MPTVPPTFVSFDSDDDLVHHACTVADLGDEPSTSPTPDPELDDRILVSVVVGDGVGAITSSDSLVDKVAEHPRSLKPRINLAELSLHSPSSILGTPFDVSPRFEYPFPPPGSHDEPDMMVSSPFSTITSPFTIFPSSFPSMALPLSAVRSEARGYTPTHPKLQQRDPPVPPTLAKKRWSNAVNGPIFSNPSTNSRRRASSSSSNAGLKSAADRSEEPISAASHEQGSSVESAAQSGPDSASSSRTSSRSRDAPKRRLGKEPEVVHSSPVGRRTSSPKSQSLEGGPTRRAHNVVDGANPEPYPDLAPSGTAVRAQ